MATVKLNLYKSKKLKDGKHPVVLLVTHNYKRKKYAFGYNCKLEEWDEEQSLFKSNYPSFKKKNRVLQKSLFRAQAIIEKYAEEGRQFSLEEFDQLYNDKQDVNTQDVFGFFEKVIGQLEEINKIGNASVYRDAYRALKNFHDSEKLAFHEIDYAFLSKYKHHLRKKGVTDNSISVYMRTLRSLFNKAINQNICKQEYYPFKTYKISNLDNETMPRAISKEDIKRLKDYTPNPNSKEELSQHLFLFSYYTRGMNFIDMALLKWSNIHGDRIKYIRSKTGKPHSIKILEPVRNILDYYQQMNTHNEYIFPILDERYDTPKKIKNRVKNALKRMNSHLKIISKAIGLDVVLTSYVARHSYATILKRSGVSTSVISEGLGHKDEKTTQTYLDSFGNDVLDQADENLL